MTVIIATVRLQVIELVRLPAFLLPLAAFPTMLYVLLPANLARPSLLTLLGYLAFAILGTMMFQFGVGIATGRNDPWTIYTQTLPTRAVQRIVALVGAGIAFSALFCVPLVVAGSASGALRAATPGAIALIILALLLGAVVHGLFGLSLGFWLPARGAVGITNLVYFPLSYVGGLFGPVAPGPLTEIHPWTPTGGWMDLLHASASGEFAGRPMLVLAGYAAAFGAATLVGYLRVERTVYA
ncbi:ABC transporter permease [Galbitalea soli]|uniref:ABC transporter permease n=1 Tax=Galbitalea soli TaxID=1268042 RepID=A0A7C9PP94_9MICO|nr:ABC transporter permease [Galbitalea soli]NEM92127.1 ABC transporter permease [Galbitalea soli]NYJ31921.1 ABC-2 type transport system permease protein [Galbitalea soli]